MDYKQFDNYVVRGTFLVLLVLACIMIICGGSAYCMLALLGGV